MIWCLFNYIHSIVGNSVTLFYVYRNILLPISLILYQRVFKSLKAYCYLLQISFLPLIQQVFISKGREHWSLLCHFWFVNGEFSQKENSIERVVVRNAYNDHLVRHILGMINYNVRYSCHYYSLHEIIKM